MDKKLKILLEIDNTALISYDKGATFHLHPSLKALIETHEIILFSNNPKIAQYNSEWKTQGYYSKKQGIIPFADVYIDKEFKRLEHKVVVKKYYASIDAFLRYNK
jgi:hypothetical protein